MIDARYLLRDLEPLAGAFSVLQGIPYTGGWFADQPTFRTCRFWKDAASYANNGAAAKPVRFRVEDEPADLPFGERAFRREVGYCLRLRRICGLGLRAGIGTR